MFSEHIHSNRMNGRLKDVSVEVLNERQRQKQRTRKQLLEAAKKVIQSRGFAQMTTRSIADQAGVAVGTVFVHFPDMSALAEELLDERIGATLERAFRTLPMRGDFIQRLLHVFTKLLESYGRNADLSREYLSASLFRSHPDGPSAQRLALFRAWVMSEISSGVAARQTAKIDPALAFSATFSIYFGVLVGGLRGDLDRKAQANVLEASLRQFFGREFSK
jgi:AcrR family transcriptional regulator